MRPGPYEMRVHPMSERARLGQTVLYCLNDVDTDAARLHAGNKPVEGDLLPAVVVANWGDSVNLRVLLDGTGDIWVTSRRYGDEPGTWRHTAY